MERNLLFLLIFVCMSQIDFFACHTSFLNFFLGITSKPVRYQPPFYPYSNSDCVCSKNSKNSFLQCEGKFLVISSTRILFDYEHIKINCNKTLSSSDLKHDYPSLIGLKRSVNYMLSLDDCPEPIISYARLLFPGKINTGEKNLDDDEKDGNNIQKLDIQYVNRDNFTIAKKHLESLSRLKYFRLSCPSLKSLPNNLFRGTTPDLEIVRIEGTQTEEIPNRMFHNLKKLREVHLPRNFIKVIKSDAFSGCRSLSEIDVKRNRLSYLEESLLDTLENITHLYLSSNFLREIPKNFKKLSKLKFLDVSRNNLELMNEENCDGFTNIVHLIVSYNGMTQIFPSCYGRNLRTLDISGKAIRNIAENPGVLNNLRTFRFRDNSKSNIEIRQFFKSNTLYLLQMSNSNVNSLHSESLHGLPALTEGYFGRNNISSVPENLFAKNAELKNIYLDRNMICSLPSGLFANNEKLDRVNLSRNAIINLPNHLFPEGCGIRELDISFNRIQNIPDRFLGNVTSLNVLLLSNNNITWLEEDFLSKMMKLENLDLSYNRLKDISSQLFHPSNESLNLRRLHLQGNSISDLQVLRLEKLEYLDLSRNTFRFIQTNFLRHLPHIRELNLSNNEITRFPMFNIFKAKQELETLELSFNRLIDFPDVEMFQEPPLVPKLKSMDLSNNRFRSFSVRWIEFAQNLEKLNISSNDMDSFCSMPECLPLPTITMSRLKVLDVSNNNLHLNYSSIEFDKSLLTWGRVSPFIIFPNLEVLLLRNNSITTICMEWRVNLPNLKLLDLRDNELQFLTHQDLIFKSISDGEKIGLGPYHWTHKLTVDLRHNRLRFVELPQRMLANLPKKNETRGAYGHVTTLLEDNPFECGCAVFNLLRVIPYDVVLTTQLKRVTGRELVFPAKFDIGNLSCRTPETVRGKKVNNTEEWIHHLIPLFGLCTLRDIF